MMITILNAFFIKKLSERDKKSEKVQDDDTFNIILYQRRL